MAGAAETVTLDVLANFWRNTAQELQRIKWDKPLKACKVLITAEVKQNFQKAQAPDGSPWAPLKRERARGGTNPLLDTGQLRASITSRTTATELIVETNVSYAAVHQYGASISKQEQVRPHPMTPWVFIGGDGRKVITRRIRAHTVLIPARPFLGFSEKFLTEAQMILADHVVDVLNRPIAG